MEITLNGERREMPEGTLLDLVGRLGLPPDAVVIERNGQIVDRSKHAATALSPGDVIELVRFVGGG